MLQFLTQLSIADHDKSGCGHDRLDFLHRPDKMPTSLLLREPAGKQNHRLSRNVPVGLEKLRIHPDVVRDDSLLGKSPRDHLFS